MTALTRAARLFLDGHVPLAAADEVVDMRWAR